MARSFSFLLLIGVTLIAEGLDQHIPKGYIYFPIAFTLFVEFLNFQLRRPKTPPVRLHEPYAALGKVAESDVAFDPARK